MPTFPYTANTPQAGQTKAFTQPLIFNNFGYLGQELARDHNVDITDATFMYHNQASMPNQADPVGLPVAGTNGMYYVNGGLPKFYNGTTSFFLGASPLAGSVQTGTVTLNQSTYTTFFTAPSFSAGQYYIVPQTPVTAQQASAAGQFVSSSGLIQLSQGQDPNISFQITGLQMQARANASGSATTFNWIVVYYTI